jgi:hypothetical protein
MPVSSDFRFPTSDSQVAKNMTRRGWPGPSVTVPPCELADGRVRWSAGPCTETDASDCWLATLG